jgi:hypothetical protein
MDGVSIGRAEFWVGGDGGNAEAIPSLGASISQ